MGCEPGGGHQAGAWASSQEGGCSSAAMCWADRGAGPAGKPAAAAAFSWGAGNAGVRQSRRWSVGPGLSGMRRWGAGAQVYAWLILCQSRSARPEDTTESIRWPGCSWDICALEGKQERGKHKSSPAGFHLRWSGHRFDALPAAWSWPRAGSRWRLAGCGGRCSPPSRGCQELLCPITLLRGACSMLDRRHRGSSGRGQVLAVGHGGQQCYALRSKMAAESVLTKVCLSTSAIRGAELHRLQASHSW